MFSMTGYGRGDVERDGRQITIELKSVNHRFLDLSFRMPRSFAFLEDAIRAELQAGLARGHVDVFAGYKNRRGDARAVLVDEGLAQGYLSALERLAALSGQPANRSPEALARMPEVLQISEGEEDLETLKELALEAARAAIERLKSMRLAEGLRLKDDLLQKLDAVETLKNSIALRAPELAGEYRVKLRLRLDEVLGETQLDEARLVQEVALYADKVAVDEEIARLQSHISALREALALQEPIGRKLDFIVQEMNREANTIGSKIANAELLSLVVALKSEIEKIREQLQNIE
ncbi:MAG: YicC family protein [Christensenellaceae bacterium]|jgi:uncharacterized protein (TIGR00255 family)|nr:YicC family protein [Christensenellaceae bacterium]